MFARPRLLYHLIWIVPAVVGCIAVVRHRRTKILSRFYVSQSSTAATAAVSRLARSMRALLMTLAATALVVGIAGPRWGFERKPERIRGSDVTILLDVSKSMLATDSKPNRFAFAKSLVNELLEQLPESRVGVIAFAGTAYTAVPYTSGRDGVRLILNDLDPTSQPYGGSHLQGALEVLLEKRPTLKSEFAPVVIFSDGEELSGSAASLLPKIKDAGYTIYSIGIGDPSLKTRIQLPDDSFVTYKGEPVRTRLNPQSLQSLANGTGGLYLHAEVEPLAMDKVAEAVRAKSQTGMKGGAGTRPVERFQWALAIALGALLLRLLIGERRHAKATVVLVFLALTLSLPITATTADEHPEVAKAREHVEQATNPKTKRRLTFVLAKLLQEHNAGAEAEEIYKGLVLDADSPEPLRSVALQNVGALHHERGEEAFEDAPATAVERFAKAVRFYRAALALRYDADLVANLRLAVIRLAEAETRLKELEARRARKRKAIEQLIAARENQTRANAQPTSDEDNDRALEKTVAAGETARPLEIPKLVETIAAASDLQRRFRERSALDRRRELGTAALAKVIHALRLLGVRDPETRKKPPQEGNSEQPPKGDWKTATQELPEGLKILRDLAKKERDVRRELLKNDDQTQRVGRGEVKDW